MTSPHRRWLTFAASAVKSPAGSHRPAPQPQARGWWLSSTASASADQPGRAHQPSDTLAGMPPWPVRDHLIEGTRGQVMPRLHGSAAALQLVDVARVEKLRWLGNDRVLGT